MSYFGVPLVLTNNLRDGEVIKAGNQVFLGTRKTYVDTTIRRITREVFDRKFLNQIGMWQPTSDEILKALRKSNPGTTQD